MCFRFRIDWLACSKERTSPGSHFQKRREYVRVGSCESVHAFERFENDSREKSREEEDTLCSTSPTNAEAPFEGEWGKVLGSLRWSGLSRGRARILKRPAH